MSRIFEVPGELRSARLYATAHGIYAPSINGHRVDDTVLAPGWTSYQHRLRYHAYDVTHLIQLGENLVEVLLGNGWYRGRLGYTNDRALYGHRLSLLGQLEVTTADGAVHVLATDHTWRARESEIVADDLYDGQSTDLRLRGQSPQTVDVEVVEEDLLRLVAPDGPPIKPTGVLAARKVWTAPSGATLVDFGQNAVGWVRLTARGLAAGTEIVLRHAEVLENGELATRPLRTAEATDRWILSGSPVEVLEPSLPCTASATPRSAECPVCEPRTSSWSSSDRTYAERAGSPARAISSTGSTRTWSGVPAATLWTYRPTAHSVTSGSAGPAMSSLRTDRHLPVRHDRSAALLARGPERRAVARRFCPARGARCEPQRPRVHPGRRLG